MSVCNVAWESNRTKILDSEMHHYTYGQGTPLVLVHGMPTSAYVWRHVVSHLGESYRSIAPDLIGMGKSGKPDCAYRFSDHQRYFDAWMAHMDLPSVVLVMHGWGSLFAFDYARRHPDQVRGLIFFESHLRPTITWDMLSLPVQQYAHLLDRRSLSYRAVINDNVLVNKMLPAGAVEQLPDDVMQHYCEPFATPLSRKVLWQYLADLPLGDGPADVVDFIETYSRWLQKTTIPKLFFYGVPGFITTMDTVAWAKAHLPNIRLAELEDTMHLAQETKPKVFADRMATWLKQQAL